MSEVTSTTPAVAAPTVETPAVEPTPAVAETPAAEPAVAAETAPVEETAAKVEEPAKAEAAVEEAKPIEPKYDGHLNYNAPTSFLREFLPLPPKKLLFWFGEEPVETKDLTHYLAKGKEAAHSTAAWASQTGKGLLYFSKTGEKTAPTGVLNLADAEDIKEAGTNEFSFKLGSHKHKFDAPTGSERDSWLVAVKAIAEEAKAKKDEILASDGYKETLAKLSPIVGAASLAKPTEATPKKSVDAKSATEETPAEAADTAKTSKSRSRSRGAPANIIGFFKGKKGEDKEVKKEEPVVAEPATTEPAVEETAATEPVAETVAAPVITDAIPPVEEKKDEAKPNRRLSRFDNFFNKAKIPGAKKEETAPATEAVTEPAVEAAAPPTIEEPVAEPAAEAAAPVEKEAEATTPTKERKPSFLSGIKSFTQKVRSPSSEHPPAVATEEPAATETPAVATEEAAATETPAVAEAAEAPATTETPAEVKEKRRTSVFGLGEKLKSFTAKPAKTEPVAAVEEPAAVEEVAKPAEEAAAVEEPAKTSTEEKAVEPKAPKEHKESPITQLGRRFSKAIRGGAKPKSKAAPTVDEAESEATKVEPVSDEAPQLPKDEPTTEAPSSIGDVVPEAVTVGTAPPASATVSATA